MGDDKVRGRVTRFVSATARASKVPKQPPLIPEGMLEHIESKLDVKEAPFLAHLSLIHI